MGEQSELDFAYKYPFSKEARDVIRGLNSNSIDQRQLERGKGRVEKALHDGNLDYVATSYDPAKVESIVEYVYARMLVSGMKNSIYLQRYAAAEARRSASALEMDTTDNVTKVLLELGFEASMSGDGFSMRFVDYLRFEPSADGYALVNQKLSGGMVVLDRHRFIRVMETAICKSILSGLPIDPKSVPKVVIDLSRNIRLPVRKATERPTGVSIGWIDRLLATPIPDCRHRTVNLILAPYFITIKGMGVEQATQAISGYIEMCKTANPDTNITDKYIRYQCEYAKAHGMHPLSLKRARVELFSSFDSSFLEEFEAKATPSATAPKGAA